MDKKVTHCPKCQKPTLNGGQFMGAAQFKIKCPWCQVILRITVQPKVTAEIISEDESGQMQDTFPTFLDHASMESDPNLFGGHGQSGQAKIPESGMKVIGYLYPDKQ